MAVNPTRTPGQVWVANTPPNKDHITTLLAEMIAGINGLDPLLTPSYGSRAAAISGAPDLAAAVNIILVSTGTALEIRARSATTNDPLFPSGDRWGVVIKLDNDRRVAHTTDTDFSAATFPAGTDQVSVATNTGVVTYRRLTVAPDPVNPDIHQQSANGTWWQLAEDSRAINARLTDQEAGWMRAIGTISNTNIPPLVNRLVISSSTELSFWRRVGVAPGTAERDDLKVDASGVYWLRDHYFDPSRLQAEPAAPSPLVGRYAFELPEEMRAQTSGTAIGAPLGAVAAPWVPSSDWINTAKIAFNTTELSVPTSRPAGSSGALDVIHPQIMEVPAGIFGYRYVMVITEYTDGLQRFENPILLVSNSLTSWTLYSRINQPYEPDPDDGHNSDPFIAYDPVSGSFMIGWRRYINEGAQAGTSVFYVRTTRDGVRWSDRIEVFRVADTVSNALSPSILYDPKTALWHMYYITKVGGAAMGHRTARAITGPWSDEQRITLAAAAVDPHHVEVRFVGNQLAAILHDRNGANLFLGRASDWTNWTWATSGLVTGTVGSMYKATILPEVFDAESWRLRVYWTSGAGGTGGVPRRMFGGVSGNLTIAAIAPDREAARDAAISTAVGAETAARTEAFDSLSSVPEGLAGERPIILDDTGQVVMGVREDGLDFMPSQSLKDRLSGGGGGSFDVAPGFGGDGLMVDAADQLVIGVREDGLDMQPAGRLVGRFMDPSRFAGVPAGASIVGSNAEGETIFAHGGLGPRAAIYRIGAAGLPQLKSSVSILIAHYGQSNAGTVGLPIAAVDKYPAHVVVPNDGQWQYGYNNVSTLINLSSLTAFRPSDLVQSGKASVVTAAGMVVTERLRDPPRVIARAEGRPAQAMVQTNGLLYQADGVTLSNNYLNFIAVVLKCCAVAAADGAPVQRIYIPLTHQEGDNLATAAAYAAHLTTLITETASRIAAVYPSIQITWLLDEYAGTSDVGNAREVRNALTQVADARADTVLVGPRYPYPLLDTIHWSGKGQADYAVMLGHCIASLEQGLPWQCPRVASVTRSGAVVTVDWTSALPITLDPFAAPYYESVLGFSLSGVDNGATIQSVTQTGPRQITVTLSATPTGSAMRLRYAWRDRQTTDLALTVGRPFGNGGVCDAFEVPSPFFPGEKVRRYALGFENAI